MNAFIVMLIKWAKIKFNIKCDFKFIKPTTFFPIPKVLKLALPLSGELKNIVKCLILFEIVCLVLLSHASGIYYIIP